MKSLICCLSLLFFSSVSYGENKDSLLEFQPEEDLAVSNETLSTSPFSDSSMLRVKGGLERFSLSHRGIFAKSFFSTLLEYSTPFKEDKRAKFLVSLGISVQLSKDGIYRDADYRLLFVPFMSGFRYNFSSLTTLSFEFGVSVMTITGKEFMEDRGFIMINAFSLGREFRGLHGELEVGLFSGKPVIVSGTGNFLSRPFVSLSVSVPIKKW